MDIAELSRHVDQYKRAEVSKVIDPADEMWADGKAWYFPVGESALRSIVVGLAVFRLAHVQSVLDLPCGHGRVARHLRAAFPTAKLSFCDIARPAVDFCSREFDGFGVYSREELTETPLGAYDVIWVGSLFTHISRERTARWLAYLAQHLSRDGIVVATFHGVWSIEVQKTNPLIGPEQWKSILQQFAAAGYGYASYPDSGSYDFGVSLSSPAAIVALASEIDGIRILSYTERGWADNHDVLVLGRTDRFRAWP